MDTDMGRRQIFGGGALDHVKRAQHGRAGLAE